MDAKLSETSGREISTTRTFNAPRDRTIEKFGALEGQKQTLSRLEEYLAKM